MIFSILILLALIVPLSLDLYLPALPIISKNLHASQAEVQLTLSLFLGVLAILQLFWGNLSDSYGRKICLLI